MPAKMHMTVPPNFRRQKELPKVLCLHKSKLIDSDIEERQGYKVTTPLKAIIDCAAKGTIADNFIALAMHQALERGLILESELKELEEAQPDIYQKIQEDKTKSSVGRLFALR